MRGIRKFVALWVAVTLWMSGTVAGVAAAAEKSFIAPVQAEVLRGFEPPSNRFGPGHRGIDFGSSAGTAVGASGAGTVSFAGPVATDLFVTIEHSGGIATTYSFLSRVDVSRGDLVAQGQVIGASGGGHPGGPAGLHFGAKLNGDYIDPRLLLADFDDISDLLQLQPAVAGSDAGNAAFRSLPAAAFVAPEIITGPDGVSGLPQVPPGFQPVPEPDNQRPIDRDGPYERGSLPFEPPVMPGMPDKLASPGNGEVSAPAVPTTGRPQEVATWWSGLTEVERTRLIANSSRIGQLEGLPAMVRNAANRNLLEVEIDNLQRERTAAIRELADLEGRYGSRYLEYGGKQRSAEIKSVKAKLKSLERRLTNARHLRDALARVESRPGDGLAPGEVYLLDFDTEFAGDEGRAVVALGNPDTAKNVGVIVPGINNRLSNFAGTLKKAADLRQTVFDNYGDYAADRTSTVAWLGYDTPESIFDAMDRGEAEEGAKGLKTFVKNLRATRQQLGTEGGRFSIFGHSYGSTTSALATRSGLMVDNLALVGSPGAAASNAKQLVGAKKVWAGRAWDDIIRFSTGFALLGDDPTNDNFGSIKIPTCCERMGHGKYFDLDTRSGQNLARILIGEHEDVA